MPSIEAAWQESANSSPAAGWEAGWDTEWRRQRWGTK